MLYCASSLFWRVLRKVSLDTANSDNVENSFVESSRIFEILERPKNFLVIFSVSSTSRISKKILDGHQKHRVSEASKTKGFLSFIILRQKLLDGKFSRIYRKLTSRYPFMGRAKQDKARVLTAIYSRQDDLLQRFFKSLSIGLLTMEIGYIHTLSRESIYLKIANLSIEDGFTEKASTT